MIAIACFEIRQHFKRASNYFYFLDLFLSGLFSVLINSGGIAGVRYHFFGENIFINAPIVIFNTITHVSYLGIIVVAAIIMGRSVQQDVEYGAHHLFFSAPIKKWQYLAGRFFASYFILALIFFGVGLGCFFGGFLPGVDATRLTQVSAAAYLHPYFYNVLPNLFLFGAVFFVTALLTRRMLPVYVMSVVLLIGTLIVGAFSKDLDTHFFAAVIDPFGLSPVDYLTKYWTIDEKNTLMLPMQGTHLYNRLLWIFVGVMVIAWGYSRFSFQVIKDDSGRKVPAEKAAAIQGQYPLRMLPDFSRWSTGRSFAYLTWFNLRETVKNLHFLGIALWGILLMFVEAAGLNAVYGTPTYPVTYQMLELTHSGYIAVMLLITIIYSGELVWRDRSIGIASLLDALPISNTVQMLSKLFALIGLQACLLLVVMLCGMAIQVFNGYYHFEPGLYLQQIFLLDFPKYVLAAVLALALQVFFNRKYLAYFATVLCFLFFILGAHSHPLYGYGRTPSFMYSDMNGYGHYLPREYWFQLIWAGAASCLVVLSLLFWMRGTNGGMRLRLLLARQSLSRPMLGILITGFLVFSSAGGVLYYGIHVNQAPNPYIAELLVKPKQFSYEYRYKKYATIPQPRITDVKLNVDMDPKEQRAAIKARYLLENRTAVQIDEIFLNFDDGAGIVAVRFDYAFDVGIVDKELGFYSYKLKTPLQPWSSLALDVELVFQAKGMLALEGKTTVAGNGTFFTNANLLRIGYQPVYELKENGEREMYKLAPQPRMPSENEPGATDNSYISNDADAINFEATISTSPDQIALTSGNLEREWLENGRRYFHYKADRPILNFYPILSARYAIKRDRWRDIAIEIYHHPSHQYNVDRMVDGVKAALDYYTKNFGPYQYKQIRIVEFPRYATYAQSFPSTIPFSESIGFIARVDEHDPNDIDYPYYVTAHEVAHQWWGHQIIPANVQGATVLSETLAQYSALMVMKKTFGADKMRRFLRYELDGYLKGRGAEKTKELPLARNEMQNYIHYQKGSLVMYLLQDRLGEDKINAVLHEILRYYWGGPSYPSSSILVDALRKITPDDQQYLIDDMFNKIVFYENHAVSASAIKRADGQFDVIFKVAANKLQAGELGKETGVQFKDWIDIGIDDKDGKSLYRKRAYLSQGEMTYTVTVVGAPAKAGIDPDNMLIDRDPDNNMVSVRMLSH